MTGASELQSKPEDIRRAMGWPEPTRYYKAVRPDGTDFYTGTLDYLADGLIEHPDPAKTETTDASRYLSVSISPTDCTGFSWPARLLEVTPEGDVWKPRVGGLPNKRAVRALRVLRELDAGELLGPQSEELRALFDRARHLTLDEAKSLAAAWDAAWAAARAAAWDAARAAAWDAAGDEAKSLAAARDAARAAAWDAAWAAARDEAKSLAAARAAARDAARDAAWDAARDEAKSLAAAWDAARDEAWDAAWDAARAAARAAAGLSSRDLIGTSGFTQEQYDFLTGPWRRAVGQIHADDLDLMAVPA